MTRDVMADMTSEVVVTMTSRSASAWHRPYSESRSVGSSTITERVTRTSTIFGAGEAPVPALKPVPGVARVTCRGTAQGQAIVNVFHVKWTGGNHTSASILYIANVVQAAYTAQFRPRLNSNWSGDSVRAVDLSSPTGEEATVSLTGQGTIAGVTTPQSAACCITWRIMRHYRGGHPRTYLGPIGQNAIESATSFTAVYQSDVQTAATTFKDAINAGTVAGAALRLVAVHRVVGGVELLVPETSDIVSAVVDSRIDTMRRRLGRDR